ncbi:hypothetical protein EsH8_VII_000136 [Colletotrichum jinshuiense]
MADPMEPFYVVLKPQAWPYKNEIPNMLGRVVKNFYSPFDQYTPDAPDQYPERKLIVHGPLLDFKLDSEAHTSNQTRGQIGTVAKIDKEFSASVSTALAGKSIWAVRLQQLDHVFDANMKHTSVEPRISGWLPLLSNDEAYFIAGLLIAEDASITLASESNRGTNVDVTVPVSTMAQLAAGSPIAIPTGDIKAGGSKKSSLLESLYGRIEGQRVIALDCRVVNRALVSRRITLREQNPKMVQRARRFAGGEQEPDPDGDQDLDEVKTGPNVLCGIMFPGIPQSVSGEEVEAGESDPPQQQTGGPLTE